MTQKIIIDDLIAPELSAVQKAAMSYADGLDISLTVDSIESEAKDLTALEDFGEPDYRDRLSILCKQWSEDEGLTALGRLSLRNKLLQHASSRLLIQNLMKRNPEIEEVEIQSPIIVAGLPRSGTTHLLNLMAADRRLRSLPLWESYEPVPRPGEEGVVPDPRFTRCNEQWQAMQAVSPLLASMHPMDPGHIHEELELMGPDFASYNYEWLSVSPLWRDHYYASDQTPHYEYMKTVLKILTWRDGDASGADTRWVLKCPQHLEQLPVLQQVFPDATVALTHRDPVSVIQSTITMLAYGQRTSRRTVDAPALLKYWTQRVEHLLAACTRDRDVWSESQSIDVPFHEFMADDLAMVERIYEKAGLKMTDDARTQLQQFIDDHPRGKHGQVVYRLREDFGVEPGKLREGFSDYCVRFGVRNEVG